MSPDSDVAKLASDPEARVAVFIDGQNLYKTCKTLFGHPLCHPHLLAEHLAGPRTKHRVRTRYYTGRPDPNRPAEKYKARNLDRRLDLIYAYGATICPRQLRYHWDWGVKGLSEKLPKAGPNADPQTVTMHPWERPQEKGIDVLIALDVIEFVLTDMCDVAIIVSLDRDLHEIPRALRNLKSLIERPYRLEAAVPVAASRRFPKRLGGFSHTHQITASLFDLIRDDTAYNARASRWITPTFPRTLADARAAKDGSA